MCGINGIYKYHAVSVKDISKVSTMNQQMLYRGPDEQDVWSDNRVVLGHVRLSIIALDNGHQPLFNEDNSIVLICNGEIYNHHEIRLELEALGHHFKTQSDCEVIIHLYEEVGDQLFEKLNGMFAFALYDKNNDRILLGRDRLGKKPLYYTNSPQGFVFSSEIKAIKDLWLDDPVTNVRVNNQVKEYSFSLSIDETYVKNIFKVKPGHFVSITPSQIKEEQYWKRTITNSFRGSYQEALHGIRQHLDEAVKIRLESEVPMAVLLSGGIDSTTIASFAKKHKPNIKALTIGYKGTHDCDESAIAQQFAKDNKIDLIRIELDFKDYEDYIKEFLPILDEPNGDIATFAQWGLYKKSKELGYKVLLSGNGGDELFFGYPKYNQMIKKQSHLKEFSEKHLPIFGYKDFLKLIFGLIKENKLLRDFKPQRDVIEPFTSSLSSPFSEPNITPSSYFSPKLSHADSVYEYVFNVWLINNCFQLGDKLGMGNTIEIRSPFADVNLINYVHSLPIEYRFDSNITKKMLKDAMAGILPEYILNQPKRGFTPPIGFINKLLPKDYLVNGDYYPYANFITDLFNKNGN